MTCMKALIAALSIAACSTLAAAALRPDAQESKCAAAQSEQRLLECLHTCEAKPSAISKLCRKQCLDEQDKSRQSCEKKKGGWDIRLPGT